MLLDELYGEFPFADKSVTYECQYVGDDLHRAVCWRMRLLKISRSRSQSICHCLYNDSDDIVF